MHTLESALCSGELLPFSSDTQIFTIPGYRLLNVYTADDGQFPSTGGHGADDDLPSRSHGVRVLDAPARGLGAPPLLQVLRRDSPAPAGGLTRHSRRLTRIQSTMW